MKANVPKIIGVFLLAAVLFNWKFILTPLVFFSMPPRWSLPIILGLFPVWVLILIASLKCFSKPQTASKLFQVALIITVIAAIGGTTINGDLTFSKMFAVQTVVLVLATVAIRLSNATRANDAA